MQEIHKQCKEPFDRKLSINKWPCAINIKCYDLSFWNIIICITLCTQINMYKRECTPYLLYTVHIKHGGELQRKQKPFIKSSANVRVLSLPHMWRVVLSASVQSEVPCNCFYFLNRSKSSHYIHGEHFVLCLCSNVTITEAQ